MWSTRRFSQLQTSLRRSHRAVRGRPRRLDQIAADGRLGRHCECTSAPILLPLLLKLSCAPVTLPIPQGVSTSMTATSYIHANLFAEANAAACASMFASDANRSVGKELALVRRNAR